MKHKHHKIPKHLGGTDDPDNIVELSVEEHAAAHWKLYKEHGHEYDRIAASGLDKLIGKEEIRRQVISAANKGKVPWNKGKKTGASKLRGRKRELTEEQLKKMSAGGKKGGATNVGRQRPDLADRNRTRDKSECQRGPDGKFKKKS
mgnify:CR=1 FL=1|tara:strand:- start:46 stop:483 length:438 start_codon:yes stop_codon:yes gene_type:complete